MFWVVVTAYSMALLLKGGYGKGVYVAYVLCEGWDTLHVTIQCDIIIIIIPENRTGALTNREVDHFLIQLMASDVDSVMVVKEYLVHGS
jgi:hypothetical protein